MKVVTAVCFSAVLGASLSVASPAQTVPFTKSRFPGVQVRHVPQKSAPSTGRASVKVLPGAPRPHNLRATIATRAEAVVSGRGLTAKGGNWVRLPASRRPLETAQRKKNGKVTAACVAGAAASPKIHH